MSIKTIYKKYFSCQHFSKYMSERLDRPLGFREKLSYWSHYFLCFTCRRVNKQIQILNKNLSSEELVGEHICASKACKEKLKSMLKNSDTN